MTSNQTTPDSAIEAAFREGHRAGVRAISAERDYWIERAKVWRERADGATGPHATADDAIAFLNSLFAIDPWAIRRLFAVRTPCNESLAAHPAVHASAYSDVGFVGLLNGLFGVDEAGCGFVAAQYDESGDIVGFQRYQPR